MFGKRRVLLAALTVSAVGTLLAALATDIGVLITARAVQGVGAAMIPLAFGIGFGLVLLAVAHNTRWPVYVGNGVLGVGVGFAFASLANLVVSAVDPRQTGEATGVNTIMRTIGGTFGAQLAATIVTANPGEAGYTTAFTLSAIAMAVAAVVASASHRRLPVSVS